MALNVSNMAAKIRTKVLASGCGAVDGPELTGFCNAVAEGVIEAFLEDAEIGPGSFEVDSVPVTGSGELS